MYFDEFKHQLPDIDPDETAGVARLVRPARRAGGREPRAVPRLQAAQARPPAPRRAAAADPDPLHQHDQPGAGAVLPGRRGDRAADPPDHPLERGRDGPPGEQPVHGDRRPPRDVRLARRACTRSGSTTSSRARTTAQAGDQIFYQGHAAPGIYARAFLEGRLTEDQLDHFRRETVPGEGLPSYPAPAAHAGLLGVPDGLDGPRADQRRSTRRASTATSRTAACSTRPARASGRSSATARPTSPSRSGRSTSPPARASTT